jgi:hypothetical protein
MKTRIALIVLIFTMVVTTGHETQAQDARDFERNMEVRFEILEREIKLENAELKQQVSINNDTRMFIIIGGFIAGLSLLGLGYRDILRRVETNIQAKIDTKTKEQIDKQVSSKVLRSVEKAVKWEVRERLNDINRAAAYFAFEEKIRREQHLLVLCHDSKDRPRMERLLTKIGFDNVETANIDDAPVFPISAVVVFADPKGEMDNTVIETYLEKRRADIRYVYYGPNNNAHIRPHLYSFNAANNCHTLLPRIIEAVRFRDHFDVQPEDDILSPDNKS